MKHFSLRVLTTLSTMAAMAVPLLAPSGASAAILVGAESNGKLVNSNVTYEGRALELDRAMRQGVQVVRGNWGWNEVATGDCASQSPAQLGQHTNPCYNWTLLDQFVEQVTSRRMNVMIAFTRNPSSLTGNADPMWMGSTEKQFAHIRDRYVAFHKAAATRYRHTSKIGFIKYWTVHNESNSPTFWKPRPNAKRYALLYARTAVAIKTASPRALVAPGPTNPTGNGKGGIQPLTFVRQAQPWIQRYLPGSVAKKRRYLNAWAHNPYPGTNTPPSKIGGRGPKPNQVTMPTIDRLFKQLDRSPVTRGTKVWATEFGWETHDPRVGIPPARQAQFIAEAFDWLNSKRRVQIGISYGITDPVEQRNWQSGTFQWNGRAKPSYAMFQRMVSVPQAGVASRVRRGTTVRIFGRSNVSPRTGVLAYKVGRVWRAVPRQRRAADGSITATMRVTGKVTQFAVYDRGNKFTGVKAGYGPTRIIRGL